ncbi:MAG: hypothetical protein V1847_02955, partial [Candidatus Diapherotrites archaeon]
MPEQDSEKENELLKKRVVGLEKELQELRKQHSELRKHFGTLGGESIPSKQKELQSRLYTVLLEKFAPLINTHEKKTVGEIKQLVDREDLTIQSIVSEIRTENYLFERDFPKAAEKAFQYLAEEVEFVKSGIPVNFWLKPSESLEFGVADDEDLAVFLCSLLYALDDEKAQVVIAEMDNLTPHAFVLTEIEKDALLLDPSQKHAFNAFKG